MNGYNIFDGVDDYITSGTIATLADYPLTISCRVKLSNYSLGVLFTLDVAGSANQYLDVGIDATGLAFIQARNTTNRTHYATTVLNIGQWYHITAVYENTTTRKLYINGTEEGTRETTAVVFPAIDQMLIGILRTSGFFYSFNGCIKDFKIWTRALSTAEIVRDSIYHTDYSNVSTTNLVHFFKLGGNYFDYGSGGATLTNSGSVAIPQLTGGSGTRSIATRHPVTDGLTTEITTQTGHQENLKPEEGSLVARKNKAGITGL